MDSHRYIDAIAVCILFLATIDAGHSWPYLSGIMHRYFLIYEILELLCEAVFYRTKNENKDRKNLLALLKTCRAFSVPATKLLWRSLSSIAPLILTMPRDLVEVRPHIIVMRTLTFRRDISASDWERFDFYAPFVKQTGVSSLCLHLDNTIRREIGKRDKILLPNLDTITTQSGSNLPLAEIFFGSQIRCISLMINASDISSFYRDIFATIPVCNPSLRSLRLSKGSVWMPSEQALFLPTVEAALDSLDLENFHCDLFRLSDHMLETLLRMPRLRKLSVLKDIHSLTRILHSSPLPVPQLKEFSVFTDNSNFGPSTVAQILLPLNPSLLEAFHLIPGGRGISNTAEEMRELVSTITNHCSPNHLKHFQLEGEGWHPPSPDPPMVLDAQLLRPLFAFALLQNVIFAAYPFSFTDADVRDLAVSWPRLESLSFDTSIKDPAAARTQTRTTLRSLLWFAVYCRNLRSLCFVFNGIDTFSNAELMQAANHKLSYLFVGLSTVTQPAKVAAFFNVVFPKLSLFKYNATQDADTVKAWRKIKAGTKWQV